MNAPQRSALVVILSALILAGGLVLAPLWPSLVLAAWFAALVRPVHRRVATWLRGRQRAAAVLTVSLVFTLLLPVVGAGFSLTYGAIDLVHRITTSEGGKRALQRLVSDRPAIGDISALSPNLAPGPPAAERAPDRRDLITRVLRPERLYQLVREHGGQAYRALQVVAGATARAILGVFLFIFAAYSFLVSGPAWYRFAAHHAPIAPHHLRRLTDAFTETGRGLLIGVGLTALAQGTVATVAYLALRIPSALVLGLMTVLGSLIPSVGSALVWVPVAAGLALSGRWIGALVLALVGMLVIGTIDNLLRPFFSRLGALQLPTFLLFAAVFGGLALFGGWGLLMGPLLLRLAREALLLSREAGLFHPAAAAPPAPETAEARAPVAAPGSP